MNIAPGDASVSLIIKVVDDALLPVTGLVAATFPSVFYVRAGAAPVSVTLVDLASASAAYSSGGVFEIGGGRYRFDPPNGAFSIASHSVAIFGEATNKRLVVPDITCRYMKSDLRQWLGIGPGGLRGGLVQVFDRQIILQVSGMTFGARTIEWGPEGIGAADDYLVGATVMIVSGTGVGQWRVVTDYVFSTGTMTVDRNWDVIPDASSEVDFRASPDFSVFAADKLADHFRRRKQANVEASNDGDSISDENSLYGMIQQAQKSDLTTNPGFITIFKTDGTTELGRLTASTDPSAEPITGVE